MMPNDMSIGIQNNGMPRSGPQIAGLSGHPMMAGCGPATIAQVQSRLVLSPRQDEATACSVRARAACRG
jgi:hypothetical protein